MLLSIASLSIGPQTSANSRNQPPAALTDDIICISDSEEENEPKSHFIDCPESTLKKLPAIEKYYQDFLKNYFSLDWAFTPCITMLLRMMDVYISALELHVSSCNGRPNRASNLKGVFGSTVMMLHSMKDGLTNPCDQKTYLSKMSKLMSMLIDLEMLASSTNQEHKQKIASKLTSTLYICLGEDFDYLLDAIMNSNTLLKSYSQIWDLIFRRVMRDPPPASAHGLTLVRYLFCFKLWKRVTVDKEERKNINKLASIQISMTPKLKELLDSDVMVDIFPKLRESVKDPIEFLMRSKICVSTKSKLFLQRMETYQTEMEETFEAETRNCDTSLNLGLMSDSDEFLLDEPESPTQAHCSRMSPIRVKSEQQEGSCRSISSAGYSSPQAHCSRMASAQAKSEPYWTLSESSRSNHSEGYVSPQAHCSRMSPLQVMHEYQSAPSNSSRSISSVDYTSLQAHFSQMLPSPSLREEPLAVSSRNISPVDYNGSQVFQKEEDVASHQFSDTDSNRSNEFMSIQGSEWPSPEPKRSPQSSAANIKQGSEWPSPEPKRSPRSSAASSKEESEWPSPEPKGSPCSSAANIKQGSEWPSPEPKRSPRSSAASSKEGSEWPSPEPKGSPCSSAANIKQVSPNEDRLHLCSDTDTDSSKSNEANQVSEEMKSGYRSPEQNRSQCSNGMRSKEVSPTEEERSHQFSESDTDNNRSSGSSQASGKMGSKDVPAVNKRRQRKKRIKRSKKEKHKKKKEDKDAMPSLTQDYTTDSSSDSSDENAKSHDESSIKDHPKRTKIAEPKKADNNKNKLSCLKKIVSQQQRKAKPCKQITNTKSLAWARILSLKKKKKNEEISKEVTIDNITENLKDDTSSSDIGLGSEVNDSCPEDSNEDFTTTSPGAIDINNVGFVESDSPQLLSNQNVPNLQCDQKDSNQDKESSNIKELIDLNNCDISLSIGNINPAEFIDLSLDSEITQNPLTPTVHVHTKEEKTDLTYDYPEHMTGSSNTDDNEESKEFLGLFNSNNNFSAIEKPITTQDIEDVFGELGAEENKCQSVLTTGEKDIKQIESSRTDCTPGFDLNRRDKSSPTLPLRNNSVWIDTSRFNALSPSKKLNNSSFSDSENSCLPFLSSISENIKSLILRGDISINSLNLSGDNTAGKNIEISRQNITDKALTDSKSKITNGIPEQQNNWRISENTNVNLKNSPISNKTEESNAPIKQIKDKYNNNNNNNNILTRNSNQQPNKVIGDNSVYVLQKPQLHYQPNQVIENIVCTPSLNEILQCNDYNSDQIVHHPHQIARNDIVSFSYSHQTPTQTSHIDKDKVFFTSSKKLDESTQASNSTEIQNPTNQISKNGILNSNQTDRNTYASQLNQLLSQIIDCNNISVPNSNPSQTEVKRKIDDHPRHNIISNNAHKNLDSSEMKSSSSDQRMLNHTQGNFNSFYNQENNFEYQSTILSDSNKFLLCLQKTNKIFQIPLFDLIIFPEEAEKLKHYALPISLGQNNPIFLNYNLIKSSLIVYENGQSCFKPNALKYLSDLIENYKHEFTLDTKRITELFSKFYSDPNRTDIEHFNTLNRHNLVQSIQIKAHNPQYILNYSSTMDIIFSKINEMHSCTCTQCSFNNTIILTNHKMLQTLQKIWSTCDKLSKRFFPTGDQEQRVSAEVVPRAHEASYSSEPLAIIHPSSSTNTKNNEQELSYPSQRMLSIADIYKISNDLHRTSANIEQSQQQNGIDLSQAQPVMNSNYVSNNVKSQPLPANYQPQVSKTLIHQPHILQGAENQIQQSLYHPANIDMNRFNAPDNQPHWIIPPPSDSARVTQMGSTFNMPSQYTIPINPEQNSFIPNWNYEGNNTLPMAENNRDNVCSFDSRFVQPRSMYSNVTSYNDNAVGNYYHYTQSLPGGSGGNTVLPNFGTMNPSFSQYFANYQKTPQFPSVPMQHIASTPSASNRKRPNTARTSRSKKLKQINMG